MLFPVIKEMGDMESLSAQGPHRALHSINHVVDSQSECW